MYISFEQKSDRCVRVSSIYRTNKNKLKRHNQAKIIKKSVLLFWLLNMAFYDFSLI